MQAVDHRVMMDIHCDTITVYKTFNTDDIRRQKETNIPFPVQQFYESVQFFGIVTVATITPFCSSYYHYHPTRERHMTCLIFVCSQLSIP